MIQFFTILFTIFIVGCASNQTSEVCDEKVDPMCQWLKAPYPPIEIQPEIGEMISPDEWKKARSLKERKKLIDRAWASREQRLSEGFVQIEKNVRSLIAEAIEDAKKEPEKRMEIYREAEEKIRNTSFGPATAALPIEKWILELQTALGVDRSHLQ